MASNGSTNVNTSGVDNVGFDFRKKGGSDCISDKNMAEMARRLLGFVDGGEAGDVVWAPEPPNDKEKIWIEKSAAGGIIGTIKRYDSPTGDWVDDHTELPDPPEPPENASEEFTMASADETVIMNHDFGTENYIYFVYPLSDPTAAGRWYEISKGANTLSLKFLDMNGAQVRVNLFGTAV